MKGLFELFGYLLRRLVCALRGHDPSAFVEDEEHAWVIHCRRCGMTGDEMWPPARRGGSEEP